MSIQATTQTGLSALAPSSKIEFHEATETSKGFADFSKIFTRILEPLYGSQESALQKIKEGKDRKALVLYSQQEPAGVLNYKTSPSNEFADKGVKNSMEIKSLFLFDAQKSGGKGLGSALMEQAVKAANAMKASAIHVTVSDEKPESLAFFKKHQFKVVETFDGKYKTGHREFLLMRELVAAKEEKAEKTQHDFSFSEIYGKKRRHRLDYVCELFQKFYPNGKRELKDIRDNVQLDGRLLYDGDDKAGALVYASKPVNTYAKNGFNSTFEVRAFLSDPQLSTQSEIMEKLFQKVMDKAEDVSAKSVCVVLPQKNEALENFLKSKKFVKKDTTERFGMRYMLSLAGEAPVTQEQAKAPSRPVVGLPSSRQNERGSVNQPWEMTLQKQYVNMIASGQKTIEGRINSGVFTKFREGDYVRFFCQGAEVKCKVTKKATYKDFPEMLTKEDFKKCLPNVKSYENAVDVYHKIPNYQTRAAQSGVLALHVEVVK